LTKATISKINF